LSNYDVIFTHCAGLDVYKKRMTTCRVTADPRGKQADGLLELQDFGTLTTDLRPSASIITTNAVVH
jgi:hypothetical protein